MKKKIIDFFMNLSTGDKIAFACLVVDIIALIVTIIK